MKDFQNIYNLYKSCCTTRDIAKPIWDDISRVTGIQTQPNYAYQPQQPTQNQALDEFVDDPTSAVSVNQFGDYLVGIMWGTGDDVLTLEPSRYVTELVDKQEVKDFYAYAGNQLLYHMNHPEAGYITALRPYAYDQGAFGTSGIGIFPNKDFSKGVAENALCVRNYGVDNIVIDEGKSGIVEIIFATYRWKVNRIVGEMCMENGVISPKLVAKLPNPIQQAYKSGDYNQEFVLVFGVFPRDDFDPKLKGKRGARYRGVWFMDNGGDNKIFYEEDFKERPISVARMIKIRGQVWGRSTGTMLISTIRSVNFMLAEVIEIIEKMGNPALGMWNSAIFGDSVLDTSPNGLTIFNSALAGGQEKPSFPLYDVGDPSGIIKFLIPYLNEKIVTAFKIDALLDFNSAKDMTATESLQRYNIRGKSLAGTLLQQKIERQIPDVKRSVSLLMDMGELGINPNLMAKKAQQLNAAGRSDRIIPPAVLQCMAAGKPWYEIKFNNELEKLTRTEAVQALLQTISAITAIAALYPDIIGAVKWYDLLKELNDNLGPDSQLLYTAKEFEAKIKAQAAQRAQAMAIQAGQAGAQIGKDASTAKLNTAQATAVQNGQ